MLRPLLLLGCAAATIELALACASFGEEPANLVDGSAEASTSSDADGASIEAGDERDAEPGECADTSEPAVTFCPKQTFCDDFHAVDESVFGDQWTDFDESGGGEIAPGVGRNGGGFASRVGADGDARARLGIAVPGEADMVHVDFDLKTSRPSFTDENGWLDLVQFFPTEDGDGAVGIEWSPRGLHVFLAGGGNQDLLMPYPSECAWAHVHLAVRLRDDDTGSVDVSINGKSVASKTRVRTVGRPATTPILGLGAAARALRTPVEVLYDNVSVYRTGP